MNLKKYAPYVFPLLVFLLVFFLIFRWFQLRSQRANSELNFSEGIQIENLSEDEQKLMLQGAGDFDTVELASPEDTTPAVSGIIRHETKDEKVHFSVIVSGSETDTYRVWLHDTATGELSPAFDLIAGKGGLVGTAAIGKDQLPVEVVVSTSADKSTVLDNVVLRGMLEVAPEVTEETE